MSTWEGTQPGSPLVAATYAPRNASKIMAEPTTETAPEAKVFYSNGSLRLDNLNGYTRFGCIQFQNQFRQRNKIRKLKLRNLYFHRRERERESFVEIFCK